MLWACELRAGGPGQIKVLSGEERARVGGASPPNTPSTRFLSPGELHLFSKYVVQTYLPGHCWLAWLSP